MISIHDVVDTKFRRVLDIRVTDDEGVLPKSSFKITLREATEFEAMYSEDFVSYVKTTIVRVSSKSNHVKHHNTISIPVDFSRLDSVDEKPFHGNIGETIYIQVRGISNCILDISRDCLYTAKVTLESFTLDGEVDGVYPWIRITASSPMTGERTIFENSFFTRHPEMREEDKIFFTNGTLTGFPEGELDNVRICVYIAVYVDHIDFLIDGYHSKMNKFPHPFCMSNFIAEGIHKSPSYKRCYQHPEPNGYNHNLCVSLLFEKETETECPTAMAISGMTYFDDTLNS